MTRKTFVQRSMLAATALATAPLFSMAGQNTSDEPLPADKVKEFVIAGHGDLPKVKTMLAEMPTLLYAAWDWKNGDFETALEGAGQWVIKKSPIT